jgi:CO/xanthine dehydrogenase Mo-binding subunit
MIARRLGIDPHDFRCKNLLARGESFRPGDSNIDGDLARGGSPTRFSSRVEASPGWQTTRTIAARLS